jgi:periplasmic divalent cation tolerance protein
MRGTPMKRAQAKQSPVKRLSTRSESSYVVALVTCGSRREAGRIARSVVERKLAACVNVLEAPVRSVYRWKGKIEQGREFLLLIKSSHNRLTALQAEIERLHSYDVPEFIALPIVAGSQRYLTWLGHSLRAQS